MENYNEEFKLDLPRYAMPPVGMHKGVLARLSKSKNKSKYSGEMVEKYGLHFQLLTDNEETGRRFTAVAFFTPSLGKNSRMYKFLCSWLGQSSLSKSDLEFLQKKGLTEYVGRCGYLSIVHSEDGAFANINSIAPLPQSDWFEPIDYNADTETPF